MAALPSIVQSALGNTFHPAKQIGKGGEGAIYEIQEQTDLAIKLYWPDKAQSRRDKVAAMTSAQWYKGNSFVALPRSSTRFVILVGRRLFKQCSSEQ
jgi:DNA-binding helix-hairpin-helix protein with protein kinase domain